MTPKRRTVWGLWLATFWVFPSAILAQGGLDEYLDTRVAAVRIQPQAAEVPADLESALLAKLPLKPGAILTREDLRDSLQVLYATLRFSQIEAGASASAEGTVITFYTHPNFFIRAVQVEGAPGPPSASQLVNAAKLELGTLFREDEIAGSIERIKTVMRDNGFLQPHVTTSFAYDQSNLLVSVLFTVLRGPRARVGAITVQGNGGFSLPQVQDIAGMHPGDPVTARRLVRAQRRLRKKYEKDKRLEAQVAVLPVVYHVETNTVDYRVELERGPKVDVAVEGASLRRGLVKRYVPIFEEFTVDEDLLNEGRRNIRDHFQSKGYFETTVDVSQKSHPEEDREDVLFTVNRGERHKLRQVTIAGNKYFDRETIRERMQVAPDSLLLYYGRFSQSLLARDVQTIEALYRSNGFLQAKVTGNVETPPDNKHDLHTVI
ncbi:MAG: hypothetical protein HYX26_06370, partial [Acidobacteriales bacterium]|nr:hypothetical protein [Terriglobales bacterium]